VSERTPAQRGRAALAGGRYDEAVRCFAAAASLQPEDDDLHYHHAVALLWRGLPVDALAALESCIALRGPRLAAALELAVTIRKQIGLPVHGQMILPGARPVAMSTAPVGPMTTLPGTGVSPYAHSFRVAADQILASKRRP
jgi:hypothetical protein